MDTNTKQLHGQLVGTFAEVYEGKTALGLLYATILSLIADAFASMKPSEFAKWVAAEFGTGGRPNADGYDAGRLPVALRAKGLMSSGAKRAEGDVADADRLNTLVSQTRVIAKAKAADPTFDLDRTFNACYSAAKANTGSNRSKTTKASAKPGKATTITADAITPELAKQWIAANLATTMAAVGEIFRQRKDAIRLASVESIRAGLVASK